jgi:hypothetical protein
VKRRALTWLLAFLRVPCGAYGGQHQFGGRWCGKTFGHGDSHCYDVTNYQPLNDLRFRAQGWESAT